MTKVKNKAFGFSVIVIMFGLLAVAAFGQKTERIKFAKGTSEGAFTRTIPAQGSIDFIVHAKAGQFLEYTPAYDFKKTDLQAVLTEPRLQDISQTSAIDQRNVFQINSTGDHRLTVNNMTRKSVTFTLYIQITDEDPNADDSADGSDSGEPERIQLARGSSDVDLEITLAPNQTKQFVAMVKKGFMVCIVPNKSLGSTVSIGVDAKDFDPSNGPCTPHALETRDQYIYFENRTKRPITFTVSVGFHEKM